MAIRAYAHMCLNFYLMCACVASIVVSCNESESEGSVPELEESMRPSEPQVSAALLKTMFSFMFFFLFFLNSSCLFFSPSPLQMKG